MFQPNSIIAGRYQVVRLVGQGGMSNLYLAYDRKYSNATVVIKEMTASYSDPKEQQMAVDLFHREAKLLASLNHRHIPKVYDYFQFAGKYYLSMEYIDGVDLAVRLEEQKGPLPEAQVLDWGQQIAQVLFYLHKHEPPIVFRDVKPSNIMLSSSGVKLIDFGIARHFDQAKKGDTMRIGSPGYAPPEQYAAQTDPRSDIYALGVTLHHALTGRDPTATNTPFLVPPARDLNPALSEATAAMLARATQLDPSDRYQSALEMRKDIQAILNGETSSTHIGLAPAKKPSARSAPTVPNPKPVATPAPTTHTAGTATAISAPATAAATSTGSGSLPTQNPASGSLAPAATSAAGPAPKKAKLSLSKLLLVAGVFILAAAGAGFASLPGEKRQAVVEKIKLYTVAALREIQSQDLPETKFRQSLLSGIPTEMGALLRSTDFKNLSKEKQELFRLDFLAATSTQGSIRVLSIVLPPQDEQPELWSVAARAVQTFNGTGGLDRALLAVVPEYYTPGALQAKLNKLLASPAGPQQFFLVLGAGDEQVAIPSDLATPPLFLGAHSEAELRSVPPVNASPGSLEALFRLHLDSSSIPTVWGVPGEVPRGAISPEAPLTSPLSGDTLSKLMSQAQSRNGRVVLLAEDIPSPDKMQPGGRLELLAATPEQLPVLNEKIEATALVLSSPFEEKSRPETYHARLSPGEALTLSQARLFDAIILAALPLDKAYHGLTLLKDDTGKYQAKPAVSYRWTGKEWLPTPQDGGKERP